MGLFGKKKNAPEAGKASVTEEIAATVAAAADNELIAVIAAAVSAFEAEQYRQTLYIRKLDRTAGTRPVWGVTGTQEAIDMRRM